MRLANFMNPDTQTTDTGILTYVLSSPLWAPLLNNLNEYLTTITLLLGIVLAVLRIGAEVRSRTKQDQKKE